MNNELILRLGAGCLASIMLLAAEVVSPQTMLADSGYSIRLVKVTPKRGTHLVVGEHIAVSVTVKYKLAAADKGKVVLVIQKDDNSSVKPGQQQIRQEVARGTGEATLRDEFDVPTGTNLIRLFIPLVPEGYTHTSGEIVIEYPVERN